MDTKDLIQKLQDYLMCSICLGYFKDPVTVKCGHSFCSECLNQCREEAHEILKCPECRGVIDYSRDLVPNKSLQNLSIIAKMLRPHLLQTIVSLTICDQHREKEKLFCEEDHRALCGSCSLAPEHKDHQVLPLEIAAAKCKEKLLEIGNILQEKEESFKVSLDRVRRREAKCKKDILVFQQLIISEYEKMYQFLWHEELLQMQKLEQQFRDNLVKFEKNKAKLSQQIQNLQRMILEVEENLDKAPSEMLQDMKGTLERKEKLLHQEPEVVFPHWTTFPITGLREMLMNFQRDITLDPETAHPHLILSEDLKSVKYGSVPQDLPDNEERFVYALVVLGAQTFTSGQHYWEVDVGDKTEWEVGICEDSVNRKEKSSTLPEDVRTLAGSKYGDSFFLWNSQDGYQLSLPIHKVGIFLDYERGHIAFYNALDGSVIYSYPNKVFQRPLRPCFSPCLPREESIPGSLIICPRSSQMITMTEKSLSFQATQNYT